VHHGQARNDPARTRRAGSSGNFDAGRL